MLVKCNEIHDITYSKGGGTIKSCGDRLFCKLVHLYTQGIWVHSHCISGFKVSLLLFFGVLTVVGKCFVGMHVFA